ncbi:MAG TPA: alpha/beta fold hydrolase [Opitutaceae bacterium]|nr:alpha/beta fold hydrolase [Opitutaceae bacterium]
MVQLSPKAPAPVLLLLHGMFGRSGDWGTCAARLAAHWRVLAPDLPVLDLPRERTGVHSLVDHVESFMDREQVDRAVIAGNSLGGHVALGLALRNPRRVAALILAGSSGLFRRGFENAVPRRPSREWVDQKIREVFFEDRHVTRQLVDEVYETVNNAQLIMKAIRMARSAKHENLGGNLHHVCCPVLLVWGSEDRITPPATAREFKEHIPQAELHFIPRCGHAPNIERPDALSQIVERFLQHNFGHAYADLAASERR